MQICSILKKSEEDWKWGCEGVDTQQRVGGPHGLTSHLRAHIQQNANKWQDIENARRGPGTLQNPLRQKAQDSGAEG